MLHHCNQETWIRNEDQEMSPNGYDSSQPEYYTKQTQVTTRNLARLSNHIISM
jgi:hypothetical protein